MRFQSLWLAVLVTVSMPVASNAAGASANQHSAAQCVFQQQNGRFQGSCGPLFDEMPTMTLEQVPAVRTGKWRDDLQPTSVWAGALSAAGDPDYPLELEIYAGAWGVLRTEFGWFPVSKFLSGSTVKFTLDASHPVAPNELDRKIVQRAAAILATEVLWNRADDRKCAADAAAWSIYCAMERATLELTGGFNHRRPALEVVRQIVEERTEGRNYRHRLMDYNNDSTTHLNDVQSLFTEALTRSR